jgi:hypothetical protein
MAKPRKAYRPRKHTFNPLAALQPLPATKVRADMDRNLAALDALAGCANTTVEEWSDLSDCVNTVEMLIEMGEIDQGHVATSQAAVGAMVDCMRRHKDDGQALGMTPPEVQAMRDLLALYHVCLERKPWMIIYKAQQACTERISGQLGQARAA